MDNKNNDDIFYSKFKKLLKSEYSLVFTDYNESFDNKADIIAECMNDNDSELLYMRTYDWIDNTAYHEAKFHLNDIISSIKDELLDELLDELDKWVKKNESELLDEIICLDVSNPIKECIDRTEMRGRVELHSNYECLPPLYVGGSYEYEGYLKDVISILYLNPAKVKRCFMKSGIKVKGAFPNYKYREGKEAVSYEDFVSEIENCTSYATLVFMGNLPLSKMYDKNFVSPKTIICKKGNMCGLFSSWNGSGSMLEMTLLRDIHLQTSMPQKTAYDKCELRCDERGSGHGYCIDEVYGIARSYWGKSFDFKYA